MPRADDFVFVLIFFSFSCSLINLWSFLLFLYFLSLIDLNIPNIYYHLSTVQRPLSIVTFPNCCRIASRRHFRSVEKQFNVFQFSLSASVALQPCLPSSAHHPNHTLSIWSLISFVIMMSSKLHLGALCYQVVTKGVGYVTNISYMKTNKIDCMYLR